MTPTVADIPKIVGQEKLATAQVESMANSRAGAAALPGPVADAFSGPIKVGNYSVRPFVAADWVIIQKLDSPLYRMFLELQKPEDKQEKTECTAEEIAITCWHLTSDVRSVYKAVSADVDAAKETALKAFFYDAGEVNDLIMAAAMEQFTRHLKTRLQHAAEMKDSDQSGFFRALMASGGSSSISAG